MESVYTESGEKLFLNQALDKALARENKAGPFMVRFNQTSDQWIDLMTKPTKECNICKRPSLAYMCCADLEPGSKVYYECTRCDPETFVEQSKSLVGFMNGPSKETMDDYNMEVTKEEEKLRLV